MGADGTASRERPFLGVRLVCAGCYTRAYRNPQGTAYEGKCPKCLKTIRFPIGSGGTSCRFFLADCKRDPRILS